LIQYKISNFYYLILVVKKLGAMVTSLASGNLILFGKTSLEVGITAISAKNGFIDKLLAFP